MAWTHNLLVREVIDVAEPCTIEVDRKRRDRVTIRGKTSGKRIVTLSRKHPGSRGLRRSKS